MAKLLGGTTIYGTLSAQTIVYDAIGNSSNWNTAYQLVSGGGNLTNYVTNSSFNTYQTSVATTTATLLPTSTFNSYQTSVATTTATLLPTSRFNSYQTSVATTTATLLPTTIYQSTSSNNASVYSLINSATANTFNLNNVSLVGNLSSNYVFGNSTETVLTDGSNLYGNGNSTITFNYLSGIYASSPIYYNGSTSDNWNSVYSLINTTSATTFNVSSLSATSNINVNGNLALNNFNSKLYFAGNYLQGNGNAIIVGAYGMGFRAQGGLANSFLLATDGVIGFGNDISYWYTNNQRVGLTYDGPATFAQKDFNNSQTYRLYNTYTDVNNYERGAITFSKPTSAFTLSVESAGTGVNRDFWINTAGTPKLVVTSGGNVGIGTINPNQTLSVFGNISSSGLIYDQIGNSNQWNTAYSLVSGGIIATFSLPQSASWISTTSTVSSLSGGWQTAYQSVSTTNALNLSSSNWNTAYSLVSGGIVSTLNLPQSASWISTTSTVSSLSGGWQTAYQSVSTTNALNLSSSKWNTAYSLVSGGIIATFSLPQSASWISTTSTVSSLSGGWQSAYTWTQNNSAIATFSTSVSTNYVYCTSLSSTYVYGNSSETTLTDGANLTGNGAGTLTLNYSNGVYIASNTVPTVDNSYNFGSGTNRWKAIYAANGTIQTSDGREKTNITPSPLGLDFINILNPVSYNFIVGGNEVVKDENGNITSIVPVSGKRTHFGLIAQEVQKAVPQGIDFGGWIITDLNDPDSRQGLRYEEFISPLIKSIQELSTTVNNLTIENQQLWSIVSSLTSK